MLTNRSAEWHAPAPVIEAVERLIVVLLGARSAVSQLGDFAHRADGREIGLAGRPGGDDRQHEGQQARR